MFINQTCKFWNFGPVELMELRAILSDGVNSVKFRIFSKMDWKEELIRWFWYERPEWRNFYHDVRWYFAWIRWFQVSWFLFFVKIFVFSWLFGLFRLAGPHVGDKQFNFCLSGRTGCKQAPTVLRAIYTYALQSLFVLFILHRFGACIVYKSSANCQANSRRQTAYFRRVPKT